MKSLLIIILLLFFSSQTSLNDLTNVSVVDLEQSVYDVNFIAYTFYLLQPNGIKLVKNTYDFYFSKFSSSAKVTLKQTTSFVQVNGTNFYLACTEDYLLMNLYGGHLSNNTVIEQKQVFPYENFNISSNNKKCFVDLIDNEFLFVTYSYTNLESKTQNNIYVFKLDSSFNVDYHHTINFITNNTLSDSYEESFGCLGLATTKYLCIYLHDSGIYYHTGSINNPEHKPISSEIKRDIIKMKISKNHFDVNNGVYRYIIGMIDKNNNQYHLPLITKNSSIEFGEINQIKYYGPSSIYSLSGFTKTKSEYYPVYFGSDFLTMEHIDNDNSIYTSLSFKPLNTFDITFSAIIQPEVSSNRYVIITGWKNAYLYLINYPRRDDDLKCVNSNLFLGSNITYDLDITTNEPKISFDSSFKGIPLKNRNSEVDVITYTKNNIIYAQIKTPEKLPNEKTNILFSFYENNITPSKLSNPDFKSLSSKIESIYFFNPNCMISLSTCFYSCKTCKSKGTDESHLCTTCKDYYNFKEGQCEAKLCGSGYVLYSYLCILCPEQNGKWYYNKSFSESSCLYNSSSDCPNNAIFYTPDLKRCSNQCPSDYPFIISSNNECTKSCPENTPLLLENIQCVNKCTSYSELINDTHCECIGQSKKDSNGKISCETIENFDKYDVDIGSECLKLLMEENSVSDSSLFHIFKKVLKRGGGITNQLEYRILLETEKGLKEVNTSICINSNVDITVPVDEDQLDTEKVIETFEAGFDIFNPNDSFYDSSNCTSSQYNNGETNIPISIRKSDYFKNYDFCETECKYKSFNEKNMTVTCTCPFKTYSLDIKTFSFFELGDFYKNNETSSKTIMKCFNSEGLASAAFVAGSAASIGQLAMLAYYLFNNVTMYQNLLSALIAVASPPKNNQSFHSNNSEKNQMNESLPIKQKLNTENKGYQNNKGNIDLRNSQNINITTSNIVSNNIVTSNIVADALNRILQNEDTSNNKQIEEKKEKPKFYIYNTISEGNEGNNDEFSDMGPDFSIVEEEVVNNIMEKPHLDEEYIHTSNKKCIRPKLDDKYFDLNFKQAQKRQIPFFHYYINLLFYNQMFLFMITKDKWNFTLTKISLFLNVILFSMLFNTIFINDSLLIYINEHQGDLSLNKAFGKIILSIVLTVLVNCVLKFLGLTKIEFEGFSNNEVKIIERREKPNGIDGFRQRQFGNQNEGNLSEIDDDVDFQLQNNKEDSNILYYKRKKISKETLKKHIFLRSLFYFIITIPITMFIAFYVSAFTSMYKKIRLHLFVYILISFLIIMFYPFVLCAIICCIRYYGLNKNKEKFFRFSKKIEWFILL